MFDDDARELLGPTSHVERTRRAGRRRAAPAPCPCSAGIVGAILRRAPLPRPGRAGRARRRLVAPPVVFVNARILNRESGLLGLGGASDMPC